MNDFRIKKSGGFRKLPKYEKVTRNRIEYYYANMFFLYTVGFLIICSFFHQNSSSNGYLMGIMLTMTEETIPILAYLYLARKNIDIVSGERNALEGVKRRLGLKLISPLKLIVSVVVGVAIIPFLSLINVLSSFMVKDVTTNKAADAAAENPMWLMLIFICFLPPIIEEITYRGIYFTAYKRGGVIKAAMLSAFIFGLMHGNLNQFAYALIAGFVFAMLTYAGGSVLVTIIVHIIINASSVISLYSDKTGFKIPSFIVSDKVYSGAGDAFAGMWLQALVGLVIVAFGYFMLRLLSEKENAKNGASEAYKYDTKTRIVDAPLIIAVIIMLANMIANEFIPS